jgi:hypothetical protein
LAEQKLSLKHLGGGKSDKWNNFLVNQTINTGWFHQDIAPEARAEQAAAILGFLAGVNPKDTIEGMMAAQLFASHASAMECYRRAMLPGRSIEAKEMLLTLAAKLTRANAAQVEALKKHRSTGEQKHVVEHVHVYPGGQAIVGNVTPGGSGKITEVQAHAGICEMLRDAVRKLGRARLASLRQCPTAAVGCTGAVHRGPEGQSERLQAWSLFGSSDLAASADCGVASPNSGKRLSVRLACSYRCDAGPPGPYAPLLDGSPGWRFSRE